MYNAVLVEAINILRTIPMVIHQLHGFHIEWKQFASRCLENNIEIGKISSNDAIFWLCWFM